MQTNNTPEQTPVKIALLGMDERSVARMATIFKMVYKDRCVIVPEDQASLAIIDLDGETDAWDEFQKKYPDLPAIVMSELPSSAEGAIYVNKPAKLDLLWKSISRLVAGLSPSEALEQAAGLVLEEVVTDEAADKVRVEQPVQESQYSSAAEDAIKPEDDVPNQDEAGGFYNPDEHLLGHILSVLKTDAGNQCSIHVRCWKDRQLILLPDQGLVFTDLTDGQMRSLGVVKADGEHATEINSICGTGTNETSNIWLRAYSRLLGKGEMPTVETDGLQSIPLDYFLWDLAQRTSRGRVSAGTDLCKPHYLHCWPNFPRLPSTPHGMRIASLWVDAPRTLDDIAASLSIDLAEVYSFYSAAVATGLAGSASRQVDGLVDVRRTIKKDALKPAIRNAILRLNYSM